MKTLKLILIVIASLLVCISNAYANPFGTDITINDDRNRNDNAWYNKSGNTDDQEVEPGMQTGQHWDLEGFALNGNKLTAVAGFNLKEGYLYSDGKTYHSGDIFIDILGDGTGVSYNGQTYEYVLDIDYPTFKYDVYLLTTINGFTADPGYITANHNELSEPYRRSSGGTLVYSNQSITFFGYPTALTDAQSGYSGYSGNNDHYAMTVDLGFLPGGTTFVSHLTIECGNDNLMGRGTAVPEPTTLLLLGLGLAGLGVSSRKFKK
jgi:hypothetical protein